MTRPIAPNPGRPPGPHWAPRWTLYTVLAGVLLGVACDPGSSPPPGRGVLVIAVDAWRFDHTSLADYDRDTTPRLARLAGRELVNFTNAWSTAPRMIPAHVSLFTGCAPAVAHRPKVMLSDGTLVPPIPVWRIPRTVPRLALEFLKDGWTTAAFVDHPYISGLRGFEYGFRRFDVFGGEVKRKGPIEFGLAGTGRRFSRWLRELDPGEDWFAYVQINDLEVLWDEEGWRSSHQRLRPTFEPRPELDFVPPVGTREPIFHAMPPSRVLEGQPTLAEYEVRYDTALGWLDQNLARILDELGDRGRLRHTTVAVVGTFGVGFGESGLMVDSGTLSDVDLHVPFLLRPAPDLELPAGRRLEALVSLVDLPPTLLDLEGIALPWGMHGVSLLPLLRGEVPSVRTHAFATYAESQSLDGTDFFVVDPSWTYAAWWPGSQGPASPLSRTWFGDERPHQEELVQVLKNRLEDPRPGNLGRGLADPDVAAYLDRVGEEWFRDLERARDVLHPSDWNADKRGPEVVAELRSKGLIDRE